MLDWNVDFFKVNSVQEAFAKCFVVHILKFEILQTTWKNKAKNIKRLDLLVKNWKVKVWWSLFHFFHVICKISNFNIWTAKHLAQASCTEFTLQNIDKYLIIKVNFRFTHVYFMEFLSTFQLKKLWKFITIFGDFWEDTRKVIYIFNK